MDLIFIKIIIQRFFELMITCAGISAAITFLHTCNIITSESQLGICLLFGLAVFIFINVRMLRQCYFELRSNGTYFLVNMSAYLLFTGTAFAVYCLGSKECFTWLFAVTKFAKYSNLNIDNLTSLLVFHIIGLSMMIFAPIGLSWIFKDDDDDEEI